MPNNLYHIPDVFESIVSKVSSKLNKAIYFSYGHYADVILELKQKDESITQKSNKYPLVWLVMDYVEKHNPKSFNLQCELNNLQFLISTPTEINRTIRQRMEENIVPILYPIYNEFMLQIANSIYFKECTVGKIEHEKIDRPYWGGGSGLDGSNATANLFNEYIDAIQIRGLSLSLKKKNDC